MNKNSVVASVSEAIQDFIERIDFKNNKYMNEKEKRFSDLINGRTNSGKKTIEEVAQMYNLTVEEAISYYDKICSKIYPSSSYKPIKKTDIFICGFIIFVLTLPLIPNGLPLFITTLETLAQIVFAYLIYWDCKHNQKIESNEIIGIIILVVLVTLKTLGYPLLNLNYGG